MAFENNLNREKRKKRNVFRDVSDFSFGDEEFEESDRDTMTEFEDNGDDFILEVELPGIDEKDIIINADESVLEIGARKRNERVNKDDKKGIYSYSKSYAGFSRTMSLPEDVEIDKIDASFDNGILSVKIPKKKVKKKKMEIEVK